MLFLNYVTAAISKFGITYNLRNPCQWLLLLLLIATGFVAEITFFSYNCFSEICCDAVKNTQCYQFQSKGLEMLPEIFFRGYHGFEFHWSNYNLSKFLK